MFEGMQGDGNVVGRSLVAKDGNSGVMDVDTFVSNKRFSLMCIWCGSIVSIIFFGPDVAAVL